jgi:hypothetical protein
MNRFVHKAVHLDFNKFDLSLVCLLIKFIIIIFFFLRNARIIISALQVYNSKTYWKGPTLFFYFLIKISLMFKDKRSSLHNNVIDIA